MGRTLICEIITPERIVYTNEVAMVVAPTVDGEVGILPLHAPLVSALKPGEIRVRRDNDEVEWFAIAGGYIQVHEDKVIILADHAAASSQIDIERVRKGAELAQARLKELSRDASAAEVNECELELKWCEAQLTVADKRKS
ncbi:MAG: ATP synthase F1 subunit epsilon [Actinomycetota bacterium]|nr:ATP synthase F1 subunit epsilon [Actinomycetota bacterium]